AIAPLVAGGAVLKPLITQAMSAMAPIMAMRAIASGDPATQALGSAAGALTGAAGDLSAAAGVMTGKGALPGAELPGMGLRSPVGAALALGMQAKQFADNVAANVPALPAEYYTAS